MQDGSLFLLQFTPFQLPTLPRISSSTRPDSSKSLALALYKSCTYLLTYLDFKVGLPRDQIWSKRPLSELLNHGVKGQGRRRPFWQRYNLTVCCQALYSLVV